MSGSDLHTCKVSLECQALNLVSEYVISPSIFYMCVLDQEHFWLLGFNQSQVQTGLFSLFSTFWGFIVDTLSLKSQSLPLSAQKKLNLNRPAIGWDLSYDISCININEMQLGESTWSR